MIPSAWRPAWRSSAGPWAASQTGGRRTSGRNGAPVRSPSIVAPSGSSHIACMTASVRRTAALRSAGEPNRMPQAACSATSEPVPRPTTRRPPAIASTSAAIFAAICGGR